MSIDRETIQEELVKLASLKQEELRKYAWVEQLLPSLSFVPKTRLMAERLVRQSFMGGEPSVLPVTAVTPTTTIDPPKPIVKLKS